MERKKICRYFERGSCRKDNCPFVHLKENRKNCQFYMEGYCKRGAACNFYHPPREEEKLANLKEELRAKKKELKEVHKDQSEEQEIEVKPDRRGDNDEGNNEEEVHEEVLKQELKPVEQQQKGVKVEEKMGEESKIEKINFLLGLNPNLSSDSDSDLQQTVEQIQTKPCVQFVKTYLKKFPDFSKTIEMKAQIAKNQLAYFHGEKYLDFIAKIQDPYQKQYYQIIRKFTDHFKPSQQQPKHFTIKIRPLLYDKEINTHFEFLEDTIDLDINMSLYPQQRAQIRILNPSIPEDYKLKFIDILSRLHSKTSLFDTLKYLQNHFEKVYGESKFRLENEHYSKKEQERKLKQEKSDLGGKKRESGIGKEEGVAIERKRRVRRSDDHPDVRVGKYKQGEKVENIFYNYQITVESIVLQNCEYVLVEKMLVYLQCVCEKKIAYLFDATADRSLTIGVKLQCKKCQNVILLGMQREVVQVRKEVLGRIGVNNGHLLDVGGVSFKIGCSCNNQISKGRLYLPGERITANCHHCFQSMLVIYMGLKSFNATMKGVQVRTDTELPNKGSCKHMKLSFRWFRFGCCGRCFSCDDCHIMESCAVHEKIKGITMLCGYCSRQQPLSNDCVYCHKQLLKGTDKTGHWQGGMGCRDQTQLSRKDPKKYTGLTKQKEKEK